MVGVAATHPLWRRITGFVGRAAIAEARPIAVLCEAFRLVSLRHILPLVLALAGCSPGRDSIDQRALQARMEAQSPSPTEMLPVAQPRGVAMPPKLNVTPDRSSFLLGPDDLVKISVLNQSDLDTTQPVRPDGKIEFFPTGDVQAGGRTVEQLRDEIVRRLRSTSSHTYRLGIQDVVDIKVYSHDDFNSTQTIGPDGSISVLPGGSIHAAGKTVDELRKDITDRVSTIVQGPIVNVSVRDYKSRPLFIADPLVNVVIQEINSQRISVLGAVRIPGIIKLRSASSLLDVISQAGGLNDDADLRQSLVVQDGRILPVNLERLFRQGDITQNVYMRANSSVFISSTKFNSAYVIGEVKAPGKVTWDGDLSLTQAIALAGGLGTDAKLSHVLVSSGCICNPTLKMVDVAGILYRGELTRNVTLKRGDVVYVPKTELATAERYFEFATKVLEPILQTESAVILGGAAIQTIRGQNGQSGASISLTTATP
jgi:polysaccharide export outer membrane protein